MFKELLVEIFEVRINFSFQFREPFLNFCSWIQQGLISAIEEMDAFKPFLQQMH